MKKSQNERILAYLQSGKTLTPLQALDRFNCLRLGGRIFNLRGMGYNIKTTFVHRGEKTFASYKLEKP